MEQGSTPWNALRLTLPALLGLFIVGIPTGFLSSLTTLRLDTLGYSSLVVGAVSSAYFLGLTFGAVFNDRVIARVGHIRAYSGFACLITVTALLQGLSANAWAWTLLRFFYGWAVVGVYLVIESWLLLSSSPKARGQILAIYMVALYGSTMLAQLQLGAIMAAGPSAPFLIAGVLVSLSTLPIVLLPRTTPAVERLEPLPLRQAYKLAPTGVVGCFGSGLVIAAVYALLPLYLQRSGYSSVQVGRLMACTILGAMLLQYPVGRWSDHQDRRTVLVVLGAALLLTSLCLVALPFTYATLVWPLFVLGGIVFTIYPVSVSLAADRASSAKLIPMIQGLLLINSAGSALSPLAISAVMGRLGARGFAWSFALIGALLVLFFLWRKGSRAAPEEATPFAPAPPISPLGVELRVTEELARDEAVGEETVAP